MLEGNVMAKIARQAAVKKASKAMPAPVKPVPKLRATSGVPVKSANEPFGTATISVEVEPKPGSKARYVPLPNGEPVTVMSIELNALVPAL